MARAAKSNALQGNPAIDRLASLVTFAEKVLELARESRLMPSQRRRRRVAAATTEPPVRRRTRGRVVRENVPVHSRDEQAGPNGEARA